MKYNRGRLNDSTAYGYIRPPARAAALSPRDGQDEVRLHVVLVEELPGPGLRQPAVVAEEAGQPTAADDLAGRRGWIRNLSGTQLVAIRWWMISVIAQDDGFRV
jgi:hypothetical protein